MLSAGSKSYTYDAAGRTKTVISPAGTTTLNYDYESRISSISGPGITASYAYNGLDTRVSKIENSVSNTLVRDGVGVTAPVIRDAAASYTPGVSERRGSTSTFLHSGLKNAETQTNASSIVSATKNFDAYGNVVSSTGTWQGAFGYAGGFGYQEDVSGLKLLGHRYYDSSTGRFLTRDPAKDGRNWYGYCGNNPITSYDNEGLSRITFIYKLVNKVDEVIKYGITWNPKTRYYPKKMAEMEADRMIIVGSTQKRDLARKIERDLVEEAGGPWNNEPWSSGGKGIAGGIGGILNNFINPMKEIRDAEEVFEAPITNMVEDAKAGRQKSLEYWLSE